ncbi:MAG: hypothetical protein LBS46_08575 [Dysgonamonadaceae bacterium]|jgi:hypothetical protein|nr:hypothetical protein [Dysgonamonadaceae bacterium]
MKQHDYLPGGDKDFLTWLINFLKYLFTSLTRFNFPENVYQELTVLRDHFAQKLELAEEPATRTKLTVQAKNSARTTLEKKLRQVVKEFLSFNHAVTDEDREGLGLPVYKTTRTPSPIAEKSPDLDVDTSVPGRITIHFFDKDSGHKKGKPAGQHGSEVAWLISDTSPSRWDELLHSSIDTKSPFTLQFENDQRGKTLYFALRWENTRGEKGPWTVIQTAIIP